MHATARSDLLRLLQERSAPCVSIYLPTSPSYPDSKQNSIRYEHLLDEAERKLRHLATTAERNELLTKFRDLMADDTFWTHRSEGLAVLGSPATFEVFDLQHPVLERAVVAESFHLTPLVRIAQSADQFHVLALQRENVLLLQGDRHHLEAIEPDGVPLTARQALINEAPPASAEEASDNTKNPPPGFAAAVGDALMQLDRYYRVVDQAVFECVSRDSRVPLVLAGLPELQTAFRSVSRNPHLIPGGIDRGMPAQIDETFVADAWKCVEPYHQQRLRQAIDDYHVAKARGMATDELPEIAEAIARSRVGILMVEADRVIPGDLTAETGRLNAKEALESPEDVLDDFAEAVLRTGGTALVLAKEEMPTASGAAAIYRF